MCDAVEDVGEDLSTNIQIEGLSGASRLISLDDNDDGNIPNIVGQTLLPGSSSSAALEPGNIGISIDFHPFLSAIIDFSRRLNTKGISPPWERVGLVSASFLSFLFASSARSLAPPTL